MKTVKKQTVYIPVDSVRVNITSFFNEKECKKLVYAVLSDLTKGQIAYGIDLTTEAVARTSKPRTIEVKNFILTISKDNEYLYFEVEEKKSRFVVVEE